MPGYANRMGTEGGRDRGRPGIRQAYLKASWQPCREMRVTVSKCPRPRTSLGVSYPLFIDKEMEAQSFNYLHEIRQLWLGHLDSSPILSETTQLLTLSPVKGRGPALLTSAATTLGTLPGRDSAPWASVVTTAPRVQAAPFACDALHFRHRVAANVCFASSVILPDFTGCCFLFLSHKQLHCNLFLPRKKLKKKGRGYWKCIYRNVTLTSLTYFQGRHWTKKPKVAEAHNLDFAHLSLWHPARPALVSVSKKYILSNHSYVTETGVHRQKTTRFSLIQ